MIDRIIATRIVNAVFSELGCRSGIDNELDAIREDREVYAEMHNACVNRVIQAERGEEPQATQRWRPS
jgi:hypothetical protein